MLPTMPTLPTLPTMPTLPTLPMRTLSGPVPHFRIRAEFEDVKALETRNSDKVASLLEEQANTLFRLEEARARERTLKPGSVLGRRAMRCNTEAAREKDRSNVSTN